MARWVPPEDARTKLGNLFPAPAKYTLWPVYFPFYEGVEACMASALKGLLFFERYDFQIRKGSGIFDEFERLARARNWRPGSRRRKYEKAWRECFGDHIPVGVKVEENDSETKGLEEEDDFVSLFRGLERLDVQDKRNKGEAELRKVAQQSTTYYGMDDRALESWQILCVGCGIDGVPDSITKCKKVMAELLKGGY